MILQRNTQSTNPPRDKAIFWSFYVDKNENGRKPIVFMTKTRAFYKCVLQLHTDFTSLPFPFQQRRESKPGAGNRTFDVKWGYKNPNLIRHFIPVLLQDSCFTICLFETTWGRTQIDRNNVIYFQMLIFFAVLSCWGQRTRPTTNGFKKSRFYRIREFFDEQEHVTVYFQFDSRRSKSLSEQQMG